MALITNEARAELIALYVGMFNAAPSGHILTQMVSAKENGSSVLEIANVLAGAENLGFQTVYPGFQTAEEFADDLTAALLAPDTPAEAVTWSKNWIISQVTGTKTPVQVIVEAVQALRATDNPNYASSTAQLENKVEVAQYYAVDKKLNDNDLIDLQGIISGVTADDATVTAGKAAVDVIYIGENSQKFNLTTGTDDITGSGGNDVITASVALAADGVTQVATTNALDSIDGGAGIDTLRIENTGGKNTLTGLISNIENLTFIGAGAVNGGADVDVSSFSGTVTLQQTDATAVNFLKVGSQTISLNKAADGATVSLDTTGATANVNNTSSAGATTFEVIGKATAVNVSTNATAKILTVDNSADNTVKTATVDASAGATVTVLSSALETVTINGAGKVTLDATTVFTKTLDASASTGGVSYATALTGDQQFLGGAGKDSVSFGAVTKSQNLGAGDDSATITAAFDVDGTASIDAGAGSDTLTLAAADAATFSANTKFNAKISNFEKLSLTAATNQVLDLTNLDGLSYVIEAGNGNGLTLNNLASGGTLEMKDASTATVIGIKDAATGSADVLNAKLLSNNANVDFGSVTVANTETVNINADNTATTLDNTFVQTLALVADKATSIVISGDAVLELDLTGSDAVTSINASANKSGLITDLSVIGKNVTLVGSTGDDTVSLGNQSTVTGGGGDDVFVVGVTVNGSSYSTITDFNVGDGLDFGAAVAFEADAITLAGTAVFQDYLDAAVVASATNDVAWFQFGGDTYVVQDLGGAPTFQNGVDAVVKLTGLVDLSDAEIAGGVVTLAA